MMSAKTLLSILTLNNLDIFWPISTSHYHFKPQNNKIKKKKNYFKRKILNKNPLVTENAMNDPNLQKQGLFLT